MTMNTYPPYNPKTHFVDAAGRPAPLLVRIADGKAEYVRVGGRWLSYAPALIAVGTSGPVAAEARPASVGLAFDVRNPE